MSKLIIDGYNLIRQVPELEGKEKVSLENGRNYLISLLKQYRKYKRLEILVVFDGQPGLSEKGVPYKDGSISVCFSSGPQTADDVIALMVAGKALTTVVVSSDRTVQRAATDKGCGVIGAKAFFTKLKLALAMEGVLTEDDFPEKKPAHKRWATYKKGPKKRLPKKKRQNKSKLKKL